MSGFRHTSGTTLQLRLTLGWLLVAAFIVQLFVAQFAGAVLFVYVVLVVASGHLGGHGTAFAMSTVVLTLAVLGQLSPFTPRLGGATLVAFGVALFAISAVLSVTKRQQHAAFQRLRHAQGRSSAIVARVGDGIVLADHEGRIIECNAAAEDLFNRAADAVVGRPCQAAFELQRGREPLDCSQGCPLLEHGELQARGIELIRSRDDGRPQPLLADVAAVRSADGDAEYVHSFRDITKLKEAEEAKNLFLATASHELKTPLTVVQGFAELLKEGRYRSEEEHDKALNAIAARAIQLNKIVDRLLLTSRVEAGRMRIVPKAIDLRVVLHERTEELSAATDRTVRLAIPGVLPPVSADPDALTTVVDHLLDNAAKYSPDGGAIDVRGVATDTEIALEVTDRGVGMDAHQLEHCFERFWQGESSTARRFGGSGIGLYIVRSLVEAMGGRVGVRSALGAGTTFTVTLRRADAVADEVLTISTALRPGVADPSAVREFMRQIGIPTEGRT